MKIGLSVTIECLHRQVALFSAHEITNWKTALCFFAGQGKEEFSLVKIQYKL